MRQLKKQLKKEQRRTTQQNRRPRRWLLLLLLLVVAAAAVPLYQEYEKTVPQDLFEEAARRESQGEVELAQQLYQRIYRQYPQTEQAVKALLQDARILQYDQRQEKQALLCYLQLQHDYPQHPLTREAQEAAAHIVKYALRDDARAIGMFQNLLEQSGGRRDRYYYEIADSYFRLDNYNQARIELEILLEEIPQTELLPDILYRKGGLLLLENRLEEAQADWQQLIDEFPDSDYSVQARFNLAKMLEEQDRLEEALELYRQLQDFPRPALLEEKIEHLLKRIAAKKKAI